MKTEMLASGIQINFFLAANTLPAEPGSIIKLMPFIEEGFFPGFGEIIAENGVKLKNLRIEKELNANHITVTFGVKMININIDSVNGSSLTYDTVANNYKYVITLLKKIFDDASLKSNRIAAIVNEGYKYDSNLELKIYEKFFSDKDVAYEWSFRQARKDVFEGEEIFNVIAAQRGFATINVKGTISESEAILVSVDNNTVPDNYELRFNLESEALVLALINKSLDEISKIKE
ncbi:hypothetical protein [Leclercia adecarboxylata]|uniref:hypothetical protein n=1 Tax=Leclercia adecarboxylata TaxID=83655 RepID=UPI003D994811